MGLAGWLSGIARKFMTATGQLPRYYHAVNRLRPRFESANPANLGAIEAAMDIAPPGDYYEFGVYKGYSLWFATRTASSVGRNDMRFYGFDSFDGFPEPIGVDKKPTLTGTRFARGGFCAGEALVRRSLEARGVDMHRVTLIKGFFDETLTPELLGRHGMRAAAVILIDCDMYESTKAVLKFLPHIIQEGTIILFDDWGLTDSEGGQQLAFREWAAPARLELEACCDYEGGKGFRVLGC